MELQLCSFELAKMLKEIRFKPDKPSTDYVVGYIKNKLTEIQEEDFDRIDYYLAPTLELAKMWFREKYDINVIVIIDYDNNKWCFDLCNINNIDWLLPKHIAKTYGTYEKALSDGLKRACLITKNKQL